MEERQRLAKASHMLLVKADLLDEQWMQPGEVGIPVARIVLVRNKADSGLWIEVEYCRERVGNRPDAARCEKEKGDVGCIGVV